MGIGPMQLPVLRQLHTLNQRVWTFVTCFVQSRRINTLYECFQTFLVHEGIRDFHELHIGNSFLHTEAVQSLYHGAVAMLNVSTRDILNHLRQFETILGHDAFRNSSHIDRNQFLQYLSQQYRQPNVEAVGISIDPTGFGVYIGLLRRLSNQEMKEMKSIEQEFQKGIAEKVFELTKEKFSAENRKQALDDLLQNHLSNSEAAQEASTQPGSDRWKKRAHHQRNTAASLSLEMLKRVTDVDVYLDNVLRRKAAAEQQTNRKQISSQEIAETDLKIRNQLTRFLMATQKSKHHSRIKVVTWVLCGIMAKIHALLLHDDKLPDENAEEDQESKQGKKRAKENDDDSEEECDCCCVGKDTCKCSCTCDCHNNSSDEEEEEEAKSNEPEKGEFVAEVGEQSKQVTTTSMKKRSNQRAEARLSLEDIKTEVEQYLSKYTESNDIESLEQLLMCFISLEIHMRKMMSGKAHTSGNEEAQDRSVLELVLELWNDAMADKDSRKPSWFQSFERFLSGKVGFGTHRSAEKEEVVGFIQQCVMTLSSAPHSQASKDDMMQQVATRARLEFGMDTLADLGIASLDEVLKEAQLKSERNDAAPSIAKYSSALLSASELHYDADNSVARPGESLRLKKSDEAVEQLLRCPYLVDIAQFLNWQQRYAPFCGSLRYFIRTHEMILLDHASSSRSLMFLYCLNGGILRINEESTPSALEMLLGSAESNEVQIPSHQVAVHLTSMIVKSSGHHNFPKQLVQAHLRSLLTAMESRSARANPRSPASVERFVLDILLSTPCEFADFVYTLLVEVAVSGTSESEQSRFAESVWTACGNEVERRSLSSIGRSMNLAVWMDKLDLTQELDLKRVGTSAMEGTSRTANENPLQSWTSVKAKSSQRNAQAIADRFTRADQVGEATVRDTVTEDGDTSVTEEVLKSAPESCYQCINQIRKEQFGIGLEIQDEATSSVLKIQQQRLERALKRLSDELYSENTHFVLELLQNADDNRYRPGDIAKGEFILTTGQEIIFHNNERGFTSANIQAICDVGASTKSSQDSATSIGKKGIGFKSVFKISDSPQVHSNGFHIRFHSKNEEHGAGLGYILPYWIDNESEWQLLPGTTFVLPLNHASRQRKDEISDSLMAFEPSILLFLRRIQELRIKDEIHKQKLHFLKEESARANHQTVELYSQISRKNSDSVLVSQQQWLVVKKTLRAPAAFSTSSDPVRETEIALALPLDDSSSSMGDRPPLQQVFAYLPLRSYGFRFILQGDFEVPSSREAIVNGSEWNQWLISQFPVLMRQAVVSYVDELLLAGADVVLGMRHLLSLFPLENEIQSPFRSVVLDTMHAISQISFLPSCAALEDPSIQLMQPVQLLDAWEMVQDEEILDVLANDQDLVFSTLNKKLLHLELSKSLQLVLKNQLRIEKLKASHILRLLSHSPTKNSVVWTVNMLRVLGKLWKRDRNSDLLLQELRLIKCFPLQSQNATRWVSLADAHDALFLPLVVDTREDSKNREDSQSFYGDLHVLDDDFAATLSRLPDTRSFLVGQVKVRTIEDHDLISHHILPRMVSLGEQFSGSTVSSEALHSTMAMTKRYTCFLAAHLLSCRSCPTGKDVEKSMQIWTSTASMVSATTPDLLVILPSTVREMPELTRWLVDKLRGSASNPFNVAALEYFSDSGAEKLEATNPMWQNLWVEMCKLPEMFDVSDPRSAVGVKQLLKWVQAEANSSSKDKVSEELARYLDKHWPTSTERIVPDHMVELWQKYKWLKGSDGKFHHPRALWIATPASQALFSESMVRYSTTAWTNEELTGVVLRLKKDPSLTDVLNVLSTLSSRAKVDEMEVLDVSQVTRMYAFLWEQAQGAASNAQAIKLAFHEQSLIFAADAAKGDASNVFVGVHEAVWSSTAYNGDLLAMEQSYPKSLREFFTEVCGIERKPSIRLLCDRLCEVKERLRDHDSKKRWKRELLPILKVFGKHCKKSSTTKDDLRRIRKSLKNTPWLPVSSPDTNRFSCCSTKDDPIFPATDDERGLQKILVSLWKDRNDPKLAPMNLVALDKELMDELEPVFKLVKLRSMTAHIVSQPTLWCALLSDVVTSPTLDGNKQRKKVYQLMKALVVAWSKAFALDPNVWTTEAQSFQWKLQQSVMFPTLREQHSVRSVDMYINDQSELSKEHLLCNGDSHHEQQDIEILSLFQWNYFVDAERSGEGNAEEADQIRNFLLTFCGAKSLKSHLTSEVIVLGSQHTASALFHAKVQQSVGIAQRFLFHHHRAHYDHLPHNDIAKMCRDLKCVMVADDGGFHVVYRVGNKVSFRHTPPACFLDMAASVLYVSGASGNEDVRGFYEVLMELCRKCFGGQLAATVANVLYLASMQPSAELMERWLVETQQLMPLDPTEAGAVWVAASPVLVDGVPSSGQTRKRSRSALEDGEVEDANQERSEPDKRFRQQQDDTVPTAAASLHGAVVFPPLPPLDNNDPYNHQSHPGMYPPSAYPGGTGSHHQSVPPFPPLPPSFPPNGGGMGSDQVLSVGNSMTKEEREAIGRWGEEYVYKQLVESHKDSAEIEVEWVNQHEESGRPYDITVSSSGKITEYVEVKSTRTMEKAVFEISMNELDQAAIHGSSYCIYRVFNAGNAALCRVIRMKNPIALVRQKKMQLALVMQ